MERKERRHHTREFKLEAVRLAGLGDKTKAKVARELGIRVNQLRQWRLDFEEEERQGTTRPELATAEHDVEKLAKGRLSAERRDQTLALIQPTADYAALADCELVIEAVFENRAIKADATRKAEAVLAPDTVFASNTSTLPITSLAEASVRPEQFVGLHFFSPVEKMPLVEVIRGQRSSDTAVAQAMDLVKRLRKTPIVVGDCHSFYANRAFGLFPYEAMIMLKEGVNPNLIENAARLAGMPMPALALTDEFSIELLYKVMKQNQADQGESYKEQPQDAVLTAMVEKFGRIGRKDGRGFYDHPTDGKKKLWPGLAEHFPLAKQQPSLNEVQKRLMYVQSIEAARCVAEGVVELNR